jgi:hypothetical protein
VWQVLRAKLAEGTVVVCDACGEQRLVLLAPALASLGAHIVKTHCLQEAHDTKDEVLR